MKSLYLLRHAHASESSANKKDIDRPLNSTGIQEAGIIARHVKENNFSFNQIISSNALRAMETAKIIAQHLSYPAKNIKQEKIIYSNDAAEIIALIKLLEDSTNSVLMVGHNPSITMLANLLSLQPVPSFRPAGIACIQINTESWSAMKERCNLKFYFDPTMIGAG
jgi:phosphohistidine phosphatase